MKDKSGLKVVAINGMPGCGKTTFESYLKMYMDAYYASRSTVDLVKEIAIKCGWNGVKDLKSRKFLSDLKDLLTEYNDAPMKDIKRCIDLFEYELRYYGVEKHPHIFISDVREPQGLQRFKDELNAVTVLIRRPDVENNETSNHADANIFNFDYDYVIWNDGNLVMLKEKAEEFIKLIFPGFYDIINKESGRNVNR